LGGLEGGGLFWFYPVTPVLERRVFMKGIMLKTNGAFIMAENISKA